MLLLPNITFASNAGFDYPAGKPDGDNYKRGEIFGGNDGWGYLEWNGTIWHPGEDWNRGSGEDDYGDPVYSISDGTIISAKDYGSGWGKIVLIKHDNPITVWSQYAHLSEINVNEGQLLKKGDCIGKIGNADGRWASHLHFEIRKNNLKANYWPSGLDKENIKDFYYSPTDFIDSHRPQKGSEIVLNSQSNSINISWAKSEDSDFNKYVLERSLESGAGFSPIFETNDVNKLNYEDKNLLTGKNYYYRVITYFNNGLTAESEEKSIELKREVINVTNDPESQRYPTTNGKIIVWQDWKKNENGNSPKKLFYYDISDGEIKGVNIAIEGVSIAQEPQVGGDYACYTAQDSHFSSTATNIYCYSFISNSPFLVTNAPKDQLSPVLNDSGIVVWSDMRNGKDSDIYYLDLNKSNGEIPFVTGTGSQYQPKISEDNVIWKDTRIGNRTDLYLKEIGGAEELIKTNIGSTGTIDISEDYIIWEKDKKLYSINIKTREEKLITDGGVSGAIRIDSGRIVYTKFESGYYYIHIYDISSSTETIIDFPIYYLPRIDISGNILVFDSGEKTTVPKLDIYLVYL